MGFSKKTYIYKVKLFVMLSRDLTATVIKTFFEELGDVRDGKRYENVANPFSGLYIPYFHQEREWFFKAEVKEITALLADDPIAKLEMLTELLYQDVRRLTDAEIQGVMFRKIIELHEVIDTRSMEFSIERANRTEELKKLLEY